MSEYKAELWAWFLRHAEHHNTYYWDSIPEKAAKHLAECGINLDKSDAPNVGTMSEFTDTFSPNEEIPCITVDRWQCNCAEYGNTFEVKWSTRMLSLGVRDKTLSDVITGVLNGT